MPTIIFKVKIKSDMIINYINKGEVNREFYLINVPPGLSEIHIHIQTLFWIPLFYIYILFLIKIISVYIDINSYDM